MGDLKRFVHISVIFLVLLIFPLIFAAPNAPTSLVIDENVTTAYDEGIFSVNWTSGGGDGEANYTLYLFADNTLYGTVTNDSNTGYTFSNTSEANYTFIVEAQNATGTKVNSSTNVSIYVDSTSSTITLPAYTNATSKKNSTSLTLNVSVSDSLSGLTGSACFINLNGTNQTVFVSSGWCNTTQGNLSGLSDGNNTISVYVNDTVGNVGLNDSFVVQMDTTPPSASASCTPSSVQVGDTITCTCSGTDTTSGVASSTSSSTPSTSSTGTYSYTCTVTDNAENSAANSASYTIEQSYSGGSGSSGSTTTFWTKGTFTIPAQEVEAGKTTNIQTKQRAKVTVAEEAHYVGVKELTSTSAKIEITSDPQEKVLSVGEEWKVEVSGDNFYDLSVKLNSIDGDKANVLIKFINEEMPQTAEATPEENVVNEGEPNLGITGEATEGETESNSLMWLWILIVVVIIISVIFWIAFNNKKRR